jgi:hypothetical protein
VCVCVCVCVRERERERDHIHNSHRTILLQTTKANSGIY